MKTMRKTERPTHQDGGHDWRRGDGGAICGLGCGATADEFTSSPPYTDPPGFCPQNKAARGKFRLVAPEHGEWPIPFSKGGHLWGTIILRSLQRGRRCRHCDTFVAVDCSDTPVHPPVGHCSQNPQRRAQLADGLRT